MKRNTAGFTIFAGIAALVVVGCNRQNSEESNAAPPTLQSQVQGIQNSNLPPEAKSAAIKEAEKAAARERARTAQQPVSATR